MTRHFGFEQLGRVALTTLAASLILAAPAAQARTNVELPTALGRAPSDLYALRPPYRFAHNAGLLTLQITNVGIIGNPFIDDLSADVRSGEVLAIVCDDALYSTKDAWGKFSDYWKPGIVCMAWFFVIAVFYVPMIWRF